MKDSWLHSEGAAGANAILALHIQPGAKKTEVAGLHGEALKIRLAAPPVDGKANDCLIGFLADKLGVTKCRIMLVGGVSSRSKRVWVCGMKLEAIKERLLLPQ